MLGILGIVAIACFLAVVVRPVVGAYLLLFTTPLIAGVARGSMLVRPNEALLVVVACALSVRAVLLMLSRRYHPPRFDRMDMALLVLVASGSVLPMVWLAIRQQPVSQDDLLYAAVLIKYYVLFRVFRVTVVTTAQVMTCLWMSITSAVIEGLIAIFQVTKLFGVPAFLHAYYDQPYSGTVTVISDRGTSTLASAFGHADLMIMNLMIVLAVSRLRPDRARLLLGIAGLYVTGIIACGEFSGYIGFTVALLVFALLSGISLRQAFPYMLSIGVVMAIPLWSVLEKRFGVLLGQGEVPMSWKGRLDDLREFFLPRLLEGGNWLLGVQPAPRVLAPEAWRTHVYVESGYVWLPWIGGVPFVLAFFYFVASTLATLRSIIRARQDAAGVAATAAFCYVATMVALMTFDPHITMRGTADLMFPLIAMSLVGQQSEVYRPQRALGTQWRSSAAHPARLQEG